MTTTLIAACVNDALNCTVVNIGDSCAHIITSDGIKTTKDHAVVNELVDSGESAPEDAGNILSRTYSVRHLEIQSVL